MNIVIRRATAQDKQSIGRLHRDVARISQGIARIEAEITEHYLVGLCSVPEDKGLMLVAVDDTNSLLAEIHASTYGLHIFNHVLTGLTIVVHPDCQGQGIGKRLFQAFLEEVQRTFPAVTRVELESRSSNGQSIGLYRSLGFVEEGRMKNKTRNADGPFEDSPLMAWYKPEFDIG